MNKVYVFYAGMLYGEYTNDEFKALQKRGGNELYNGAYIFQTDDPLKGWGRMDQTPLMPYDVPKELLLIKLLLT